MHRGPSVWSFVTEMSIVGAFVVRIETAANSPWRMQGVKTHGMGGLG